MTETTVSTDLLQTLQILAQLRIDIVGQNLAVLAIDDIALTIEEPSGDFVLRGVLDDGDNSLKLFGGELTSTVEYQYPLLQPLECPAIPLSEIYIGLLANQVGVAASNSLDFCQGYLYLLFTFDICIEQTKNLIWLDGEGVLEGSSFRHTYWKLLFSPL
jgi:hypothetical protein